MRRPAGCKLFFAAVTLFLAVGFAGQVFADDIILNDLQSGSVNIPVAGKPCVLLFWTTWCPYCRSELKALNKLYPGMEKEGVAVFAVNVGEAGQKVERFLKSQALELKVFLDKKGKAADNYEVMGVPTYILLNKSGKVVSVEHSFPEDYKSILSE
ncbi:MAG: TlpA disulfide reductase family protein [Candidatus Omnitrophica bacterium]|nr:TlpA disulfide reductase family protein [Candidatus Omnitrophota bacterium]